MPTKKPTKNRGSKLSHNARAVVTGAGSGIGRAFSLELARRGGEVICADISLERAKDTVALIDEIGGTAHAVKCDVSIREQVQDLALFAELELAGPLSLVINNAGVGIGGKPVGEIGFDDWEWALGINLWGVVHGCEIFAPQLRASGAGGFINVASAAGFAAAPLMAPYNVGKAAVMSLSETLSAELAGTGVRVTVLCPTFVKTNVALDGRITAEATQLAQAFDAANRLFAGAHRRHHSRRLRQGSTLRGAAVRCEGDLATQTVFYPLHTRGAAGVLNRFAARNRSRDHLELRRRRRRTRRAKGA